MTSSIQNTNFPSFFPSSKTAQQSDYTSNYKAMTAQRNQADISIMTKDGDIVTLSQFQEQSSTVSLQQWNSPYEQGLNFTASSLSVDAFDLSVKGDLDEGELQDIQHLLDDLSLIAENFFSGNLSDAFDDALNLGDMGSLAQLSASFSYTAQYAYAYSESSQLSDYHPLPTAENMEGAWQDFFADLPEFVEQLNTDEMKYAEQLHAQWQQIKEYLESRNTEISPRNNETTPPEYEKNQPVARRMMNRFQEIVAQHPRLAPLGPSLAHKAIDDRVENADYPALHSEKNQLKNNFMREFNNWMYA
ncbi:MAG: hypothetical protein KQH63_19690 [Desulfobulbaceae bacterium]|nr:hypothetical protein [Desulfobulbaceae bacterium]